MTAKVSLARALLNSGEPAQAEAMASALIGQLDRRSEHRLGLLGLRADARDALGRHADAFSDYAMRNALLDSQYTPLLTTSGEERRIDQARRLKAYFDGTAPEAWAAIPGVEALPRHCAGHLFVIGFPRSGTTLLEKALSGHNAIRTLPEIDCLGGAGLEMLASNEGLDRLAALTPAEIEPLRARYFAAVRQAAGDVADKVLVDKLPLHSISLPLITRLFPEAKLVLSLRDPRDVVLSGFRRRFQMNMAMFELLTLSRAADYYDAVMAVVERYRAVLPIDPLHVRHEELATDFRAEVGRVLDLLGLDWDEGILDFPARAAANLRTPSDLQLRRGLRRDGIGTWRGYAAQLRAVRPILDRWAARWGYPAD